VRIWVDADACPREVKEVVYRASERLQVPVSLVANLMMEVPGYPLVTSVRVPHGADAADEHIVESVEAADVVITADIPLAAQVVQKGAVAIDPRGQVYDENNVHERLATRNLMDTLRGSGLVQGGPASFRTTDKQQFANALDRELAKRVRR